MSDPIYSKSVRPPDGWGKDELSAFLELAHRNAFSIFHNYNDWFSILGEIHLVFEKISNNLGNVSPPLPILILLRAHSAYLATIRLAVSGQIPEAHVLMRNVLGNGLYAWYIKENPEKAQIWSERHKSDTAKKAARKEFRPTKITESLENADSQLIESINKFYDHTIDFGAHPNPFAMFGGLNKAANEEGIELRTQYVNTDPPKFFGCLIKVANVGIIGLEIACKIIPERASILGIADKTKIIKQQLNSFSVQYLRDFAPPDLMNQFR
jgi:hypothetical protein